MATATRAISAEGRLRRMANQKYCDKCGYIKEQCECGKTKTNADRIRSMSDEELAEKMFELENKELCKVIPFCKSTDECTDIMDSGELIPDELCKQCPG